MKGKLVRCLTTATIITMLATGFSINTEAATQPKLNKTKITITEGKSYSLKVRGISSKVKVTWKSSKKSVASVTSKGRITARKGGVSVVSARFSYKKSGKKVTKTLKCKVTVKAKRVQATKTPKPTNTPKPTSTPKPTVAPTATPKPTATSTVEPTSTPEPTTTSIPESVQAVSPETPVHTHNYNARYEVIKESTCTEDGLINLYCECGEEYERVICADHHNVSFVGGSWKRTSPTETTDGYFGIHCNDCGQDVTFSERTTFPALTDENYPLEGWVYEIHTYRYPQWKDLGVDSRHKTPYIVVTDYIGTAEHPALKDKYVIDGVEYDVELQGKLNITSPTVQSLRLYGMTWVNPDDTMILEKKISYRQLGGSALIIRK